MADDATTTPVATQYFVDKEIFQKELDNFLHNQGKISKCMWSYARVKKIINTVEYYKEAEAKGLKKSRIDGFYGLTYDVVEENGEKMLYTKPKKNAVTPLRVIPCEEYYELLSICHLSTSHGGRDKINKELRTKMKCRIPPSAIKIFLSLCNKCMPQNRNAENLEILYKSRGHFKMIDYQTLPDKQYKCLLIYVDQETKFCVLRPIYSNQAKDVASELFKIFMVIGCPIILQGHDRDFVIKVFQELERFWPKCPLLIGKQLPPDSLGQEIRAKIDNWMKENKSTSWTMGCRFVQFETNAAHNSDLKKSPYKAMFGRDPSTDFSINSLPETWRSKVKTEEDLEKALHAIKKENMLSVSQADDKDSSDDEMMEEESDDVPNSFLCYVCDEECTGEHKCFKCERAIHKMCGKTSNSDIAVGSGLICTFCFEAENVKQKNSEENNV